MPKLERRAQVRAEVSARGERECEGDERVPSERDERRDDRCRCTALLGTRWSRRQARRAGSAPAQADGEPGADDGIDDALGCASVDLTHDLAHDALPRVGQLAGLRERPLDPLDDLVEALGPIEGARAASSS